MNYQRIYDQICQRAKNELSKRKKNKACGYYYEGHHIIPQCLGGLGKSSDLDHDNIALLTTREHFLCHWLLHEIYPDNSKLAYAFHLMCEFVDRNNYTPSSRLIEYARKIAADKKRGSVLSTETRLKMSNSQRGNKKFLGKKHSEETKKKISQSNKGKPSKLKNKKLTENTKIKMRLSKIGDKNPNYGKPTWNKGIPYPQKRIVCDHCGKEGGIANMKRYHLDNCKFK